MKKVQVKLQNCYGIGKLEHLFSFDDQHRTFSIYSPNGMMKTSLANTFRDLQKGGETRDMVFTDRKTQRRIIKDNEELKPEEVFVIQPYEESFFSEKMSTLLANQELKEKYEKIHEEINDKKSELLAMLKESSELKEEDIDKEISKVFMQNQDDKFFEALESIEARMKSKEGDFENISYKLIFSERAIKFFQDPKTKKNIEEYVKKYDQLIEQSTYFKKGIFNHSQAENVAKDLTKNHFFEAEHAVLLKGKEEKISTEKELTQIISDEKDQILENKELKERFNSIDALFNKNQELRNLREYIQNHNHILGQLDNIDSFKAKVWMSYLWQIKELYDGLLKTYKDAKIGIERITNEASKERTKWLEVVEIFNKRFHVPFSLAIENGIEVILSSEIPVISFEFEDRSQKKGIEREQLLQVLSQGEKRALYLLNIIFEVEARKEDKQETLFVIDDIADSFDYKNKYAIIEYLQDISSVKDDFYQIILTHNFDFHRTISHRLNMQKGNMLNALKINDTIKLKERDCRGNPFNGWRNKLNRPNNLIASIPFVRNLAEFSGDMETCKKLTHFVHMKEDTRGLKVEDLKSLFGEILESGTKYITDTEKNFIDLLDETSSKITKQSGDIENLELEDKITLALSIRLKAEQFMYDKVDKPESITQNQTRELVKKYKDKYVGQHKKIEILEKVLLMTPEHIHINSFMYEPIIDMSGEYLEQLYNEVNGLSKE